MVDVTPYLLYPLGAKFRTSKILFQFPRLSVHPLSLSIIPPTNEFDPRAPLEELDNARAAGTF